MIAKGNTHGDGGKLAAYMLSAKDGEKAELFQLRGFDGLGIKDAFRVVAALAEGTNCDKPFFHIQVRNPDGEALTRAQWENVADRIESKLGYSGQPRAISFHTDLKSGHEHMHLAFSRIDEERMTAKPLPFFKLRLKEICRELEIDLDLTRVRNDRERPEIRPPSRDEQDESRRLNVDVHAVRAAIRDAFDHADGGKAFAAALRDNDLTLCRGERRDYVVLDHEGGIHVLGKRVLGTSAVETRKRLADLDHAALPSVDAVREQLQRPAEIVRGPVATHLPETAPASVLEPIAAANRSDDGGERLADRQIVAAAIGEAWKGAEHDAIAFAVRLGHAGLTLAEDEKGRFIAVDSRGWSHFLTAAATGEPARDVQAHLKNTFGKGQEIGLPSEAEVVAEARAEQREIWLANKAIERRAAFVEKQRERLATNATVQAINRAWDGSTSSPTGFVGTLEREGLVLCRATEPEAAASRFDQIPALLDGDKLPREIEAGGFYAVNRFGDAYLLDAATIWAADRDIRKHLDTLGPHQPTIAEGQEKQAQRREAWKEERAAERADAAAAHAAERRLGYVAKKSERLVDNKTVQAIDTAWQQSQSGTSTFAAALDRQELILARATETEAKANRYARSSCGEGARRPPEIHAGALYAVNRFGDAYVLDGTTIKAGEKRIAAQFGLLDKTEQPSLTEAREEQKQRQVLARVTAAAIREKDRAAQLTNVEDVRQFRATWQRTYRPEAFIKTLELDGYVIGRVTAEDAVASRHNAMVAASHGPGRHVPIHAEGDLVAFAPSGASYRLDGATLDDRNATTRLATVDTATMLTFDQARQAVDYFREEPKRDGASRSASHHEAGGHFAGLAMQGASRILDAAGGFASGLEHFLFSGSNGGGLRAAPSPRATGPINVEGKKARHIMGMTRPEEAVSDPNIKELVKTYTMGVRPELVEAMRRRMEEARRRERDDEHDRER